MSKIAILTDSNSGVTQDEAKKLGVGGNGSRNELIEKIRNAKEPEDGERDAEEPDGDVPGFTAELPA